MKRAFFGCFLLIAIVSCTQAPQKPLKKGSPAGTFSPTQQLIKHLKPVYEGVWVRRNYIEKVKQTHSVLAAVDLVPGVNGIQIDTAKVSGDSLQVAVGWDNHVPGRITLRFRPGKKPKTVVFGEDELGYNITKQDTTLILYQVFNKVLFKTVFQKAKHTNPDETVSDGLNYAINSVLFAGDYTLKDLPQNTKVTFSKDGTVTGLDHFKKYVAESDLKRDALQNLDLVTFDSFTNQQQAYSYVFRNDVLELYEVKPNAKNTLLVLGKLKYKLKRIN
ncbi:hypothetical protein A0256_02035 [Mucilaginibacter sp. PAMC 26640]|nr:hypothetical protein A0256_02035 [Mucilaginibacter sp. PAMC 26640]